MHLPDQIPITCHNESTSIQSNDNNDKSMATEGTIIAKAGENFRPRYVIFYYHELFGCRKEEERITIVLRIDSDYKMKMLHLDNWDVCRQITVS